MTLFVWPLKVLIGVAVLMSQRMAVLSYEAVRIDLPSGEKQHEMMACVWPLKVLTIVGGASE